MSFVDEAIVALRVGKLLVIPTDTVYGLAAPLDETSIGKIFEVKGRPRSKPLPVLGASVAQLEGIAEFNEHARKLAARFWPGPLTMVLRRSPGFEIDLGGNNGNNGNDGGTVGVRVPKEPRAIELLKRTGPLAVTSANVSGGPESTTVEQARAALKGHPIFFVDGGRCTGRPSTIVFLAGERRVLREGSLTEREVLEFLAT
ncbi:MAG: L-threonylcarbamoyladenylate synthase [Actinomycetota bacterium]|nr:L-threonylcarbamoyladenylate synthase [Actinomycetota bacterium]